MCCWFVVWILQNLPSWAKKRQKPPKWFLADISILLNELSHLISSTNLFSTGLPLEHPPTSLKHPSWPCFFVTGNLDVKVIGTDGWGSCLWLHRRQDREDPFSSSGRVVLKWDGLWKTSHQLYFLFIESKLELLFLHQCASCLALFIVQHTRTWHYFLRTTHSVARRNPCCGLMGSGTMVNEGWDVSNVTSAFWPKSRSITDTAKHTK